MKISVAADHAGFAVKNSVVERLKALGHLVEDLGAATPEACDYPFYAEAVAKRVASGQSDAGVVLCGNGIGMSIAANKVRGARASLCYNEKVAVQTREHNDSNVLVLPGREFTVETNLRILEAWIGASFTGVERHARRVRQIGEIEARGFR